MECYTETFQDTSIQHIKLKLVIHQFRTGLKKYTYLIKQYVDSLNPELSNVWSLDEMSLNVKNTKKTGKGFHDWLWSIIDPKTRYLIATEVSKKRRIEDVRKIIVSGKKIISKNPDYILTDCLNSY